MKVYTVAEALELEDKMPLPAIKGTLIKVWPAKPFTFKKGPRRGEKGSVQNLTLQDDTGQINIKNWATPLPQSDRGEEFLFESHKGAKGGLKGLSIEYDSYDKEMIISMNENAKIKSPDGSLIEPKPKTKEEAQERKASRDPYALAKEAKEGCRLAMKMALELRKEMHEEYGQVTGEDIGAEQVNSWASSINYYLRDKCVFSSLIERPAAPESAPAPKPAPRTRKTNRREAEPSPEDIHNAKPKMTNPPEDEIPF